MKKRLVISCLILSVLAVIYIVIIKLPENRTEKQTADIALLQGFEIESAEVENSFGKYTLTYSYPDWILDNEKVGSKYVMRLSEMKSSEKELSSNLKEYGLESPSAIVKLTGKDGSVKTLTVGDPTPDKRGRYVMIDGVYVVRDEYVGWLLEDKAAFVSADLYLGTSPVKIEFNGICFEMTDGAWRMTHPYDHGVKESVFYENVMDCLSLDVVDITDKTPSECGLAPPKQYVSVWDEDNIKTTICFGDTADGLIYAMREGGAAVCRVKIPFFLDKKPTFFINTLCYVKNIDEIDKIQVNEMCFDISDNGIKKDGKEIGKEAFVEFYKQLMGMTLIDEAVDPVRDKLILSMKVSFKDGTSDVVDVYEYKERYGAVFINGACTFYTLRRQPEEIVSQAEKL